MKYHLEFAFEYGLSCLSNNLQSWTDCQFVPKWLQQIQDLVIEGEVKICNRVYKRHFISSYVKDVILFLILILLALTLLR